MNRFQIPAPTDDLLVKMTSAAVVTHLQRALLAMLCVGALALPTPADVFELRNGGTVVGELTNPNRAAGEPYRLRTNLGVELSLQPDELKSMRTPNTNEQAYKKSMESRGLDDAAEHQKMVTRLAELQMSKLADAHRERVVELDPSDSVAWRGLGYVDSDLNGKWELVERVKTRDGYVKDGGRWYMPQELLISNFEEQQRLAIAEVNKEIRLALRSIQTRNKNAEDSLLFLQNLDNPLAVADVAERLEAARRKPNTGELRPLLMGILTRINSFAATDALVTASIEEPNEILRNIAIRDLVTKNRVYALGRLMSQIRNWRASKLSPRQIDRIAEVIQEVGDESVVRGLIGVLVTEHEEIRGATTNQNLGVASDGGINFAQGAPQTKFVVSAQQTEVLEALEKFAGGVNFGFEEPKWLLWYAKTHAHEGLDLRRDP